MRLICFENCVGQVKEAAQVALIVLIERSLVPSTLVEEILCPAVLNLPCEVACDDEIDFVTGIVKVSGSASVVDKHYAFPVVVL